MNVESSVGNLECEWICQMELNFSGLCYPPDRGEAASKGHFLKLVCATFTTYLISAGYFIQNMCDQGKV